MGLAYILLAPVFKSKIVGKEKVSSDDEARVFITNHYEMFGPITNVVSLPWKFRPWIIDKMIDESTVEEQMGLLLYKQYKKVPRWIKTVIIKCIKSIMVFTMKAFKGISVSRDNVRANLKTMKISTETMEKNKAILIFPEKYYVKEGVGPFMKGFEHIGKYHYQKTGKKITFYPMFTSYKNKTIYIGEPITFNPNIDNNIQKDEIVKHLNDEMVNLYFEKEVIPEFYKKTHKHK